MGVFKKWLETFLELPGGIPSHDTINRGFQMIDPDQFHNAFFWWTSAVAGKIEGLSPLTGRPSAVYDAIAEALEEAFSDKKYLSETINP